MSFSRTSGAWLLAAFTALAACDGGEGEHPPEPTVAPGPSESKDAQAPSDGDARPPERLGSCGAVTPATHHLPFEAIKRLATTREEVRILVYGQSISAQDWWFEVRN